MHQKYMKTTIYCTFVGPVRWLQFVILNKFTNSCQQTINLESIHQRSLPQYTNSFLVKVFSMNAEQFL